MNDEYNEQVNSIVNEWVSNSKTRQIIGNDAFHWWV
jgi:hypothetical protein